MKHVLLSIMLFCGAHAVFGQVEMLIVTGTTSYVSSQNVYVKFTSTEHIHPGDTLYVQKGDQWLPALLVKDKSSTSCVCTSLLPEKVKTGDAFVAKTLVEKKQEPPKPQKANELVTARSDSLIQPPPIVIAPASEDKDEPVFRQKLKGRISAASYSNFSGEDETHRMRYTMTFQGNNINNSRFSTDNYITFRHTAGEWQEVKNHFNDALKIYSLSVKYDLDKRSSITLGRKINQRISSMGAIDGLQAEKGWNRFFAGVIAGSRPDYADYSINLQLLQGGAYAGYGTRNKDKFQESTLAVVEQRNHASTDRRFVYFQHSNSLLKNLNLFSSFEVDLYQNINGAVSNRPSLTNLLLTLRYKVSKKLGLSAAYDNRKNIIYYESYKNFIDQLIDNETRQGLRLGANYRFSKLVTLGSNLSWRFQKSNLNNSQNLNSYLNFSRLPWVKATVSLSANILHTGYLDSKMYGVRINKEIVRNKWNGEVYARWVDYNYKTSEVRVQQQIAGVNVSWNITRKLALYLYYEGTFDAHNTTFNRINSKLIQRF